MDKREAGRLGGLATARKYGSAYMREIGKRGYKTTSQKYEVLPARLSHWVMVHKDTGKVVAEW